MSNPSHTTRFESYYAKRDNVLYDVPEIGRAERILDAGCGDGILTREWCRRFPEIRVDAVEIVETVADVAAEQLAAERKAGRVRIYHGNVSEPDRWRLRTLEDTRGPIRKGWDNRKYDVVVFNPGHICSIRPDKIQAFHAVEKHHRWAVFDPDYANVAAFLKRAHDLVHDDGVVILTCSTIGDLSRLFGLLYDADWCWEVLSAQELADRGLFQEYIQYSSNVPNRPLWFTLRLRRVLTDKPPVGPADIINNHRYTLGRIADECSRGSEKGIFSEWIEQSKVWVSRSMLPQLGRFLPSGEWIISMVSYPAKTNAGRLREGIEYEFDRYVTTHPANRDLEAKLVDIGDHLEKTANQAEREGVMQTVRTFVNKPSEIAELEVRRLADRWTMTYWPVSDRLQVFMREDAAIRSVEEAAERTKDLFADAASVGCELDENDHKTEYAKWEDADSDSLRKTAAACIYYTSTIGAQDPTVRPASFLRTAKFRDWSAGARFDDGTMPKLRYGGCLFITSWKPWEQSFADFEGLFRNLEHVFAQMNLALTSHIRRWRREVVASRNSVSRIMLRNLAHHIGSHVLSRTKVETVERQFAAWRGVPRLRGDTSSLLAVRERVDRLVAYVEARSVFMAELVTRSTSFMRRCSFLSGVVMPFARNTLVIDGLVASRKLGYEPNPGWRCKTTISVFLRRGEEGEWERLRYGAQRCTKNNCNSEWSVDDTFDFVPFDGMCPAGEHRSTFATTEDFDVALPGANGPHGIFLILENVIRNSCRHQPRHDDQEIRIRIDVTEREHFFDARVYDPAVSEENWDSIRDTYARPYTEDSIGEPRRDGRGVAEIKAMSHFISGSRSWDVGWEDVDGCEVSKSLRSDGTWGHAYTLRLWKPAIARLVGAPESIRSALKNADVHVLHSESLSDDRIEAHSTDFLLIWVSQNTDLEAAAFASRREGARILVICDGISPRRVQLAWKTAGGPFGRFIQISSFAESFSRLGSNAETAEFLWRLWLQESAGAWIAVVLDDAQPNRGPRTYYRNAGSSEFFIGIGRHRVSLPKNRFKSFGLEVVSADSEDYRLALAAIASGEELSVWGRFIEAMLRQVIVLDERCAGYATQNIDNDAFCDEFGLNGHETVRRQLGISLPTQDVSKGWPSWVREALGNLYLVATYENRGGEYPVPGGEATFPSLGLSVDRNPAGRTEISLWAQLRKQRRPIAIRPGAIFVAHQSLFAEVFQITDPATQLESIVRDLFAAGISIVLVSGQGSLARDFEDHGLRYCAWSTLAPLLTDRGTSKIGLLSTLVSAAGR